MASQDQEQNVTKAALCGKCSRQCYNKAVMQVTKISGKNSPILARSPVIASWLAFDKISGRDEDTGRQSV